MGGGGEEGQSDDDGDTEPRLNTLSRSQENDRGVWRGDGMRIPQPGTVHGNAIVNCITVTPVFNYPSLQHPSNISM